MIAKSLRALEARVIATKRIGSEDVRELCSDALADGLTSRAEADLLIGFDRLAVEKDPAWAEFLVHALVDFVVWTSRPTGYVDAEAAGWLTASLGGNGGASATAMRIAFEIVCEAERVDEILLAFALRSAHRRNDAGAQQGVLASTA